MQDLSAEKALKCDYEGEEMLDFNYKKARAFSELMDALSQLFPHSLSQVVKWKSIFWDFSLEFSFKR